MTLQVKELINKNDSEKYQGRERLNALRSSSTVVLYHRAKSSNSIGLCTLGILQQYVTVEMTEAPSIHFISLIAGLTRQHGLRVLHCSVNLSLLPLIGFFGPLFYFLSRRSLFIVLQKAEVQELVSINLGTLFTGILKYDRPAPHIPCVLYILCRHMEPRKL